MMALSRPISADERPNSRHRGVRKGSKTPTATKYAK
jgi:hypothetical protein